MTPVRICFWGWGSVPECLRSATFYVEIDVLQGFGISETYRITISLSFQETAEGRKADTCMGYSVLCLQDAQP